MKKSLLFSLAIAAVSVLGVQDASANENLRLVRVESASKLADGAKYILTTDVVTVGNAFWTADKVLTYNTENSTTSWVNVPEGGLTPAENMVFTFVGHAETCSNHKDGEVSFALKASNGYYFGAANSNLLQSDATTSGVGFDFVPCNSPTGAAFGLHYSDGVARIYGIAATGLRGQFSCNKNNNTVYNWSNTGIVPTQNNAPNTWAFRFAVYEVIDDSEIVAGRDAAKAELDCIKAFYHDQTAFEELYAAIDNATSLGEIGVLKERVYKAIDKKLVYLKWANRKDEATAQYLGVVGDGDKNVCKLLDGYNTRAKWQIVRVPNTDRFKMRNIASNTYMHQSDNGQTSNTSNKDYTFNFVTNTAFEADPEGKRTVSLKYSGNNTAMTISDANGHVSGHQHVLKQIAYGSKDEIASTAAAAWIIEPVGVNPADIPAEGEYYVIRSNRALTGTTADFINGFPGALLGVYTPDREKARTNAGYVPAVHLREYMTGMQTIWKIVPQTGGGYKIYNIMGEGDNDAPLFGMTLDAENYADYVTITNNPTTLYLNNPEDYPGHTDHSWHFPNGVTISRTSGTSGQCLKQENELGGTPSNSGIHGDFFVKLDSDNLGTETSGLDQGTIFYIERVSDTEVNAAKEAFKDYARNTRMFELLKNVLSPEEMAYALSEKTTDPASVNSVKAARDFLLEGEHAASTLAFQRLDGKVVRFANRMHAAYYMSIASSEVHTLHGNNTAIESDMSSLWKIEVVNPAIRQVRLLNYGSGRYAGHIPSGDGNNGDNQAITAVENVDDAGLYVIARYYSIDGTEFYANLLEDTPNKLRNALHMANNSNVVRWEKSAQASHWTIMPVMTNDATNAILDGVEMVLDFDTSLASITPKNGLTLTKTEGLGDWHNITLTATPKPEAPALMSATEPIVIPHSKVVANGNGGYTIDLTDSMPELGQNYELTIPAGFFTTDGRLTPELKATMTATEPSGISEIGTGLPSDAATVIYDLQGRRLSAPAKGINIINGRKVLVK